MEVERILVIKPKALGDVIITTPIIRSLRRNFPKSFIAILVEEKYKEVIEGNPNLNEIIFLEKSIKFISKIRKKKFSLVIDLFCNPRTALLTYLSGAKIRVGFGLPIRKYAYNKIVNPLPRYVVEANLDCLRALGLPTYGSQLEIFCTSSDRDFVENWYKQEKVNRNKPMIGIGPGGGWQAKRWQPEKFAGVANKIKEKYNAEVLLIAGPEDEEITNKVLNQVKYNLKIVREFSIKQLATLFSDLKLYICNDSGPRYIAIAANTPTVTFFGPTNHINASPVDGKHLIARVDLICSPCNKLECDTHECMSLISVDDVLKLLDNEHIIFSS